MLLFELALVCLKITKKKIKNNCKYGHVVKLQVLNTCYSSSVDYNVTGNSFTVFYLFYNSGLEQLHVSTCSPEVPNGAS